MRVIVAGTRTMKYQKVIDDAISNSAFEITEVVSGNCVGVDRLGEEWAKKNNVPVKLFPYQRQFGMAGGPVRNTAMAKYAQALIAFWDGKSKGTKDMILKAIQYKIPMEVHYIVC